MSAEILQFPQAPMIGVSTSVKLPPNKDHKHLVCHECHSTKLEFVYTDENSEWLRCGECYEIILFPDDHQDTP